MPIGKGDDCAPIKPCSKLLHCDLVQNRCPSLRWNISTRDPEPRLTIDRSVTMHMTPLSQAGNAIEASVRIQRPVGEVFNFYRDFRNLSRFLGDVMAVEPTGPTTSRWTIQGPLGIRARSTIKVTEERANALIRYETDTSPGLRTYWEIHFRPGSDARETIVREVMRPPLGRLGRVALDRPSACRATF